MKNKFLLYLIPLVLFANGCKKDFLEAEPSERLSSEQLKEAAAQNPALLDSYIAGLYSIMYSPESGGTTNHDDFGQKGYDIYMDMVASDMVLGAQNYGWYAALSRYTATVDFTTNPVYQPWRYYYRMIFQANTAIDALGGNDFVPTTAVAKRIIGQAKAMRAHSYFYLAQLYAREGYGTGNEKILPMYLTLSTANEPKSTSAQIYTQIVKDLREAITYLDGFSRGTKEKVDKYVAKGILSYVLAARGTTADLQEVVTLTKDVIDNSGYRLYEANEVVAILDANGEVTNPESGFNNVSNNSWIWGADLTIASNLDLVSWWGQVDLFTYSYAWAGDPKKIDKGLYDVIHTDDVRRNQFDPVGGGLEDFQYIIDAGYAQGDIDYMPVNKFFDPGRVDGGQRVVTTDLVYMRMEEMYLLNAEAHARLTQDVDARNRLKELLAKRITNYSYVDALSGQALKDEIYLQTRIELWGEGKTYLAMKRNKKSITRGSNHLFFPGNTFAYNAPELTLAIPQAEVINNPKLNN